MSQIKPKQYKAVTIIPKSDPFMGGKSHEVTGYYVKHITATPNPINTPEGYKEFVETHTKHYIFTDGFSDWNLPREMEFFEIDISTLKEVNND